MKNIILILLSLTFFGCAHSRKRVPDVVASCFSDGENQDLYCKAQRVDDYGKIVTTRCIGTQNREAPGSLRGKCVEKICSEGSNTDCQIKGEILVLQAYADLMTSGQFASDEGAETSAVTPNRKVASAKGKAKAKATATAATATVPATPVTATPAAKVASTEVDIDPSAKLAPLPTPTPEPTRSPRPGPSKAALEAEAETETPSMSISLKPAKPKKKSRVQASLKDAEKGFKKVCIDKNDTEAPTKIRGKCATRNCTRVGKCTYKGRKEIFDWVARAPASEEE